MSIIALSAIFITWITLTILRQLKKSRIQYFDILDLIPNCRFFAPKPLSRDYRIYAQSVTDNKDKQDAFKSCFTYTKYWYSFLWNPNQKIIKTINDLCSSIITNIESKNYDLAYFILLNMVNSIYKDDPAVEKISFVIVAYSGYEDPNPNVVFKSNVHKVDRNF